MPVIQMNSFFPSSSVRALPAEDVYVLGESLTSEDDGEAVPSPDLLLSPRLLQQRVERVGLAEPVGVTRNLLRPLLLRLSVLGRHLLPDDRFRHGAGESQSWEEPMKQQIVL